MVIVEFFHGPLDGYAQEIGDHVMPMDSYVLLVPAQFRDPSDPRPELPGPTRLSHARYDLVPCHGCTMYHPDAHSRWRFEFNCRNEEE